MRVHAKMVAVAGLLAAIAAPLPASAQSDWFGPAAGVYDSTTAAARRSERSYLGSSEGEARRSSRRSRASARVARSQYVDEDGETVQPRRRASRTRISSSDESYEVPSRSRRRGVRVASLGNDYVGGGGGQQGIASFYWQPQRVASGGWFNPNAMTAAHKTLPFGTRVRVTHLGNGRSVTVTINDRGPYIAGRIIDLSKAAAGVIGMQGQGIARVRMEVLGR